MASDFDGILGPRGKKDIVLLSKGTSEIQRGRAPKEISERLICRLGCLQSPLLSTLPHSSESLRKYEHGSLLIYGGRDTGFDVSGKY